MSVAFLLGVSDKKKNQLEYTLSDDGSYYIVTGIGTYEGSNVTIPDTYRNLPVKAIGDDAFGVEISSISIGKNVTSIKSTSFKACSNLNVFYVDSANTAYSTDGKALFNKNKTVLVAFARSLKSSYTIPSTVTSIGAYAFTRVDLKNFTIPLTVTSIGAYAFAYADLSNTNIDLTISGTIGKYAFNECNVNRVNINSKTIGESAFYKSALTYVKIGTSVTTIEAKAFQSCYDLVAAEFEMTTGWKAETSQISSNDLSNTGTAATYLRATYSNKKWTRT